MSSKVQPREASAHRRASAMFVGWGLLLCAAVALWWMFRDPDAIGGEVEKSAIATQPYLAREDTPRSQEHAVVEKELAGDKIPIMAPGSADNSESEPRHPHPITPAHERNFRQLNRIAQLNSAMDLGDVDELRMLNKKYRDEYPQGNLYQDGYDLIADCLENRTSTTQAAAERYWNTQVASNLRRYIRRYCLE